MNQTESGLRRPEIAPEWLRTGHIAVPEKPITKPAKPSPAPPKAAEKASTDEKVEPKAEVKVAAKETKEKKDGDGDADVGTLNKRLKDTRDYATKLGQENKELKSPTLPW